ncbi:hypothetical protein M441DRAFT_54450 [Trichoderma asperellum CBS 433.97]|uniref:Uncharacterized protein n=1 Tax=Trichoderma asperellum (strain ATCC 204424 / CBS 433.97 / NBRC 101777) TaxID=1042311 RepID=A0A2T3ZKQ8_TRIA4|nr:hypothetical protein M441DRAFT_54450 [Trichoderma asperellum CBS 433.97]PTB45390.1 hypothetical protein M441DRAFT_54450 [Trichoderma asperellum CBS 433.97]
MPFVHGGLKDKTCRRGCIRDTCAFSLCFCILHVLPSTIRISLSLGPDAWEKRGKQDSEARRYQVLFSKTY